MALVYRHRRLDTNEIFYIGIELDSSNKKAEGKRSFVKNRRNQFWKNIINKTNYEIEIIYNNLTNESAKELEIFLINLYGRRDLKTGSLVNLTDGGEGITGFKHSTETINKMSKSAKGRIISEEQRIKISNSNKVKKLSKKTVNKILESIKKYKHSLETKDKISASAKGFSKSARKNAFEKLSKKVIDIELNIIYNSIREASLNSNFSETTIRRFLNNKYPNKTNLKYLKDYEFTRI